MKWIFLLLTAAMLTACSEMHQKRKIPECKTVFDICIDQWYFDQKDQIYRSSYPKIEIELMKNKDCFKGLNGNSIENIFGVPNLKRGTSWFYYVSKACSSEKGPGSRGCSYVEISFDKETRKTIDFGIGGS